MQAHQFRIVFQDGDKLLAYVHWPDVPRVGETVELRPTGREHDRGKEFSGVVEKVQWMGDTESYGRSLDVHVTLTRVDHPVGG